MYGVPKCKEKEEVPLKVFIRCSVCNTPFCGYVVKKKNLWYYKCRTKGCRCNRRAIQLHSQFKNLLQQYTVNDTLLPEIQYTLEYLFTSMNKDREEQQRELQVQLNEINRKIDTVEEKYFVTGEMGKETYEKFRNKYSEGKTNITQVIENYGKNFSNLQTVLKTTFTISSKLPVLWESSQYTIKEKLQKAIFPEGIIYDREIQGFRTPKVHPVFEFIASINKQTDENKKGQTVDVNHLSCLVASTGIEPVSKV
jgi:site-specific DNA recombinase